MAVSIQDIGLSIIGGFAAIGMFQVARLVYESGLVCWVVGHKEPKLTRLYILTNTNVWCARCGLGLRLTRDVKDTEYAKED